MRRREDVCKTAWWNVTVPFWWKSAAFQQLTESERERIISFREGEFFFHAIGARVHCNSIILIMSLKARVDENRTTRNSGSGPRKLTSTNKNRYLVHMPLTNRTATSIQLPANWLTATDISLSASSVRRCLCYFVEYVQELLYTASRSWKGGLRLQWSPEYRDWRTDW